MELALHRSPTSNHVHGGCFVRRPFLEILIPASQLAFGSETSDEWGGNITQVFAQRRGHQTRLMVEAGARAVVIGTETMSEAGVLGQVFQPSTTDVAEQCVSNGIVRELAKRSKRRKILSRVRFPHFCQLHKASSMTS